MSEEGWSVITVIIIKVLLLYCQAVVIEGKIEPLNPRHFVIGRKRRQLFPNQDVHYEGCLRPMGRTETYMPMSYGSHDSMNIVIRVGMPYRLSGRKPQTRVARWLTGPLNSEALS